LFESAERNIVQLELEKMFFVKAKLDTFGTPLKQNIDTIETLKIAKTHIEEQIRHV
jgi:hypothetical protein